MRFINRFKKFQVKLGPHTRVMGWEMNPAEIQLYFNGQQKKVLTFYGYSGLGYENETEMLWIAAKVLDRFQQDKTVVNIGATQSGVGRVYQLAKEMGYETTGIVSIRALDHPDCFSHFVDKIFVVEDRQWGGYLPDSRELSPTSEAMVSVSDYCVGIGGNDISRDELLEAKKRSIPVLFFPADFKHPAEIPQGQGGGDFRGSTHTALVQSKNPA